jgi:hypothetical protein
MPSGEQEKALMVFEHALEFLDALLSAVGAENSRTPVHLWQSLLEAGEKINPADIHNRGTLGDVLLCAENGHKVTESQRIWINTCFGYACGLAGIAAEFLWVYERLIVKEEFTIGSGKWKHDIVTMSCPRCLSISAERRHVEASAAIFWALSRVRSLIIAGRVKEAIHEALSCTSCFVFITALQDVFRQNNVAQVENGHRECASCGATNVRYSGFTIRWDEVDGALQRRVL